MAKRRSLATAFSSRGSASQARSSKSSDESPNSRKSTRGGGSPSTAGFASATSSSVRRTRSVSEPYATPTFTFTRTRRSPKVSLVTASVMNCPLGTMMSTLLSVVTTVARARMSRTVPRTSPTCTKSPFFTGRSSRRISPLTKFWAMFCRPKPIPTARIAPSPASAVIETPRLSSARKAPSATTE